MNDFFYINRNALILRPTRAMIEWANQVFPDDPVDFDSLGQHDEQDIFLLPNFDSVEETLEWVKENCEDFLSHALDGWCTDSSAWPSPLDWALFERFFTYQVETAVIDTMDAEYDDEEEEDFNFDFEDN